ncbi:unnamed protein product, partial [Haemonchus placei]|uniref:Integrase_H2C2 domain-containing protein n=1 Tax=Haemonchus placei TaxID=6290 RepID=A0A0N4X8P0_HAEPC
MTAAETLLILAHYREDEHILQRLPLHKFDVQKDRLGLLRCPFRVGQVASAPVFIIPPHRLATILVWHHHLQCYHAGVYSTITALRTNYFIPSIHSLIARTLRTCVVCRKVSGHAYRLPEMPTLPEERTTRSRPFQYVGIDYLGPLSYRSVYSSVEKIWVCLITCMATRAVHLELVVNNTVQEFLLAFRRFIARRGTPDIIYSDNATTFHAADDDLSNVVYATGNCVYTIGIDLPEAFEMSYRSFGEGAHGKSTQNRRHNPDAALRLSEDNETQLAAVAPEDKAFLFLLQRLTITLNPDYVFRTAHLGAHDYVSIDAFLRSDYHRMIRSYFTKEIILPDWADEQAAGYPYFTVFEIVQHLKGIRALTQELVEYLTQASQSHRSPDALALFVHIEHIHDLIHNIDHRNIKLLTHLQIYVFRGQQPPPQLVDLLAYYDVHWADLQEAAAAANAAVAEARTVLATLMDIHRSHLRESQFPEEQQGQLEQYPGTPHPLFEQLDQAQSSQQQQRERRPSSTSQSRTASPQSRASAPPPAQAAGAQPEARSQ